MQVKILSNSLKKYLMSQIDSIANNTPIVSFMKPLIIRAIDKNFSKIDLLLYNISDNQGEIEVNSLIDDLIKSVVETKPFVFKNSFGDMEIGGGFLKLNIPFINKTLVFDTGDLETFKDAIIKS